VQRARYGVTRVSHRDALRWRPRARPHVSESGAWQIAIGKMADLALFKLDDLRFSGHGDPLALWCCVARIAPTG